jgi:dTDP-4-dehydrorhamnose 3,5-epimerase-like enzyme
MTKTSVYDCSYIELGKHFNEKGNLTVVENNLNIPFEAKRIFFLYDIPGGESRGAHAHKKCHQFLVAASGTFEVALDDGKTKRTILLSQPYYGLYIPPGIWAAEQEFSSGSICLVLASHEYDAEDYIRDYDDYLTWKNNIIVSEVQ